MVWIRAFTMNCYSVFCGKGRMAKKDITQKSLEELNDVFADIVNVLLFNGKQEVKENRLEEANPRSNYNASGKIREQERDVVKYLTKQNVRIAMIGFENESGVSDVMPIRAFGYDGAGYRDQIKSAADRKRQKKNRRAGKEVQKGKFYPVITLVLYFGYKSRWNRARTLYECIDIDEHLKPYVNDYKINLFEIAWLTDEQVAMFKSDFKYVADYYVQLRKTGDYKPSTEQVRHVNELLNLMSALEDDARFEEHYIAKKKGERTNMSSIVLDKAEARGEERGIKIGEKRGVKIGEKRGEKRGEDNMSLLIKSLLSDNRLDDVKKATTSVRFRKRLYKEYGIIRDKQ